MRNASKCPLWLGFCQCIYRRKHLLIRKFYKMQKKRRFIKAAFTIRIILLFGAASSPFVHAYKQVLVVAGIFQSANEF